MPAQDIITNALVRRVFAAHWVDATHISHRSVRGHVYVTGRIVTIGGSDSDGDEGLLQRLHAGILAVPDVEGVVYNLDNWMFDGMAWKMIGTAKLRHARLLEVAVARRKRARQTIESEDQTTPT